MRRLAAVVAALVTFTGAAAAATILGTARADVLVGTPRADTLDGRAGADLLRGLGGADTLLGGAGADRIAAAADGARDRVECGSGIDLANADLRDDVDTDCETVVRQLSADLTSGPEAQHRSQVEPDSFAYDSTVATVYQVGRIAGGGAGAIGWSTSTDGGRTWRSGLLPRLTRGGTVPGPFPRASDPTVAYDAGHGPWLAASLAIDLDAGFAVVVSRSSDGLAWSDPVTVVSGPAQSLDKEWIACDNWLSSPFRGRCHVAYLDRRTSRIESSTSSDGGLTWSAPVPVSFQPARGIELNGAQVLPRPDGSLVVVFASLGADVFADELLAAVSVDGGSSFGPATHVAALRPARIPSIRSTALPTADVAADGTVYVLWNGCADEACAGSRLWLSSSADGTTWSAPAQVSPAGAATTQFLPGLAADPSSTGASTRLAAVYASTQTACPNGVGCRGIDVWLVRSEDAGATWSAPRRLSAETMAYAWLPRTTLGLMLGDYVSVAWADGKPTTAVAIASPPVSGSLRQSVYSIEPR